MNAPVVDRSSIYSLQWIDHTVLRIEPLHVFDQLGVFDLGLARHDDAGSDWLRLRVPARQDLQGRLLPVSCKQRSET